MTREEYNEQNRIKDKEYNQSEMLDSIENFMRDNTFDDVKEFETEINDLFEKYYNKF